MKRREYLYEEGLPIAEFSNDFFKDTLKENPELSEKIAQMERKFKEKHKDSEKNVWHNILGTVLAFFAEESDWDGFEVNYCDNNDSTVKGLTELLLDFYNDTYFHTFEIAQMIKYNLQRLGKIEKLNLETDEQSVEYMEVYQDLLKIGRHEYEDLRDNIGDKESDLEDELKTMERLKSEKGKIQKRSIRDDLLEDLKILREKNKDMGSVPQIRFLQMDSDNVIYIEDELAELNISYLANEKFQEYLSCKESNSYYSDILQDLMEHMGNNKEIYYAWEKLTNYNTILLIAKFLVNCVWNNLGTKKEKKKRIKQMVEAQMPLFKQIFSMKNYLTRLVLIKQVFGYIEESEQKYTPKLLRDFMLFLIQVNDVYKNWQAQVCIYAVFLRWKLNSKLSIDIWKSELQEEYPISLLKKMLVFQNVWKLISTSQLLMISGGKKKIKEEQLFWTKPLLKLYFRQQVSDYDNTIKKMSDKHFDIGKHPERERILRCLSNYKAVCYIMEIIDENFSLDSEGVAKKMESKGVIAGRALQISEGWDAGQDTYIDTPFGRIFTESMDEIQNDRPQIILKDNYLELQKLVKEFLLSDNQNIMLESRYVKNISEKDFKEIISFLLYHI